MTTQTLSGGRAGVGSAVVADDATARTVNIAGAGVVTTAASGSGGVTANTFWSLTDKTASVTLSGSNLIATSASSAQGGRGADIKATGKWYFELTCNTFANTNSGIGIANAAASLSTMGASPSNACFLYPTGNIWLNNASTGLNIGAVTAGTIVGIAFDLTNNMIWFRLGAAGNWNGNTNNNPATNVGGISFASIISTGLYPAYAFGTSGEQVTANFGDTAFTGTVPSGFTAGFPIASASIGQQRAMVLA